jgi:anti-sigma B factor antagonist
VGAAASGEIDMANAASVRDALLVAIEPAATSALVLDLSAVTFIDSCGLSTLIKAKANADARGIGFAIGAVSSVVARTLEVAGLVDHLNVASGSPA